MALFRILCYAVVDKKHNGVKLEKLTFAQMLDRLFEAENDIISLSSEEIKELLGDIKGKVDGIHFWLTKLDAEEERIGNLIKSLKEKKDAVRNSRNRFKEYIAETMIKNDTPKIFGQNYNLGCISRTYVKAKKDIVISTLDYATVSEGVIKREYSFDARLLANAFKDEPEKYKKYVTEEVKPSIRFTIRKDN